jgi:hypothetical protein
MLNLRGGWIPVASLFLPAGEFYAVFLIRFFADFLG